MTMGPPLTYLFGFVLNDENSSIGAHAFADLAGDALILVIGAHCRGAVDAQVLRPDDDINRALLDTQAAPFTKVGEHVEAGPLARLGNGFFLSYFSHIRSPPKPHARPGSCPFSEPYS